MKSASGLAEASLKDRCALFRIEWHEKPPAAEADAVDLVPAELAVRLRLVPLRVDGARLVVAMADPFDLGAVDEISTLVGRVLVRVGVEAAAFGELMRAQYGTTAARMAESLASDNELASSQVEHNLDAIEADDVHRMAEQPTLINLVNLIILEAIQNRTSDIHLEPFETELKVKYRIDGVLVEQPSPPKHLQPALIGRVKIMAHMNIAERYVPQDGHITLRFFHFSSSQQAGLARGTQLRCFGEVRRGPLGLEIVHPEYRQVADEGAPLEDRLTPIYPTTEGVAQGRLRALSLENRR